MTDWLDRVRAGDFSTIPASFAWDSSAEFTHLLNGYDASVALGYRDLDDVVRPVLRHYRESGEWQGSAMELWLTLFALHRSARHGGWVDLAPEHRREDALCCAVREALQHVEGPAKATLVRLMTEEHSRLRD